ncbi:phosphopentomutase [Culicoides brevitarsis]|uniref:phosphopentomutase n=1 Tax=Culicoides brevitarsis TaxID=469753 RepID=UPI00307B9988
MTCNSGCQMLDQRVDEWLKWDKNDKTRKEIQDLVNEKAWDELKSRLNERLAFGTAGLRGKMQAGFNGMNDLVIVQTAQGLVKCLFEKFPHEEVRERGVVIGFDGRHNSKRFAELSATIFLAEKTPVYLFHTTVPTPFVPFTVLEKRCVAGIMVTASHNPKEDNGYKVYWSNGAQIMSPHDKDIQKSILNNLVPLESSWDLTRLTSPLVKNPYDEILSSYCSKLRQNIPKTYFDCNSKSSLKFVYTAMHGVGYPYVVEAFKAAGLSEVLPVLEQRDPDPEFPTVKFPNPEEGKSCLNLSIALADKNECSIILANDPDADRLAVAEKNNKNEWRVFTGNELGALLGWWAIQNFKELNPDKSLDNCYLLASTVSSKILNAIAKVEGCHFEETLTGFKFMGNRAIELIKEGKTVLFAFEEAIGFMFSSTVLDKDGVSAAAHLATMASYLKQKFNRNLSEQLDEIYKNYGFHCTKTSYYFCYDPNITFKMFQRIRNIKNDGKYPESVSNGKYKIAEIHDITTKKVVRYSNDNGAPAKVIYGVDLSPSAKPVTPTVTSSQMIIFTFENGVVITLRTSGTEPKIKYYAEMCAKPGDSNFGALRETLDDVISCVCNEFLQPTENNLKPKSD